MALLTMKGFGMLIVVNNKGVQVAYKYKRVIEKSTPIITAVFAYQKKEGGQIRLRNSERSRNEN
jgi:hypothetical protein